MNLQEFRRQPVIGILRGIEENMIEPLSEVILTSGLKHVEVTMNTENIKDYLSTFSSGVAFGASIFNLAMMKNNQYDKIAVSLQNLLANAADYKT